MDNKKFRLGIPNGSLVDEKRGGLREILEKARICIKGIGENTPLETTNIDWLEAIVGRPQEFPSLASDGFLDAFFCGDDWAREWALQGKGNKKVLGLGTGKVDIIVTKYDVKKPLVMAATEYPNIAAFDYFGKSKNCRIIKLGDKIPLKRGVVIIESKGATEAKQYYGLVDAIVEATQSGDALRNFGLSAGEIIMQSECSFYSGPSIEGYLWKRRKTERIKMMLEGALAAEGRDYVTFNVSNTKLKSVVEYIRQRKLFADEETLIKGKKTSQIGLELKTSDPKNPIIDIICDLKMLGATAIEGIPVSYSIK